VRIGLPILGPSTIRDSFGLLLDTQADLVFYIDGVPCITPSTGRVRSVTAPNLLDAIQALSTRAALDKIRVRARCWLQRYAPRLDGDRRGNVRNRMMNHQIIRLVST